MDSLADFDKVLDEMVEKHNDTADDVYKIQSHLKRLQVAFNKRKGGQEERGRTVQRDEDFNMNIDNPTDTGMGTDLQQTPVLLQVPSFSPPPAPLPVHDMPAPAPTSAAANPTNTATATAVHPTPSSTFDAATAEHTPGPVLNLIPPTPQGSQEANPTPPAIHNRPPISIPDQPIAGPSRLAASGPMTRSRSRSATPMSASSSTSHSSNKRKPRDEGEAPEHKRRK